MTDWAASLERAAGAGAARRWIAAGLAVGAVYAAGLLWALAHPTTPSVPVAAPAVMVQLAPLPVAADTSRTRQGRDSRSAPQVAGAIAAPSLPPKPGAGPQLPRAVATPRPDAPLPVLPPASSAPPAPEAEQTAPPQPPVPPRARPARAARGAHSASARPSRQKAQPASRASERASAKVRQDRRTAARQASAGTLPSARATAQWQARLQAHLARYKQYPADARARGETGTVLVRFRLDARGRVLSVRILRSSGHPDLDAAVLRMVRRAAPMPPPPAGSDPTITAPISFSLR